MNKTQLIDAIAEQTGLSRAASARALDALVSTIQRAVARNDTVTLVGFGTFKQSKRAARSGRNPRTGQEIKIAAARVPRFIPGAAFKVSLAGGLPGDPTTDAPLPKPKKK